MLKDKSPLNLFKKTIKQGVVMSFNLCCSLELSLSQELSIRGGATQTIFPKVERWLQRKTENWQALQYIAGRKQMERYRSIVDFVFCEIFIEWQNGCFRYYEERGKKLRFLITREQRQELEKRLLAGLKMASKLFQKKRRMSWTSFRCEVLRLTA